MPEPSQPTTPPARRLRPQEFQCALDRMLDLRYSAVDALDFHTACFWRDTAKFYRRWHFECMLAGML
jgi:hypothetical protein